MAYQVVLTGNAANDLQVPQSYILNTDGKARARHLLQPIDAVFNSPIVTPDRGPWPAELLELGIRDYRELFFKPYRVIYQVVESSVYVLMVVDGRRDMQSLLQSRLLRS